MAGENDKSFLPVEEVKRRIAALPEALCRKLENTGNHFTRDIDWSGEDLLQEAFTAVLDGGRRQWRADLSAEVFLTSAMRSLADARRKALRTGPVDHGRGGEVFEQAAELAPAADEDDPSFRIAAEDASRSLLREVRTLFKDDPEVLNVIARRCRGEGAGEIMLMMRMTKERYLAVCKRMQRGLGALRDR